MKNILAFASILFIGASLFSPVVAADNVEKGIKEAADGIAKSVSETAKKSKTSKRSSDKKEYRRLRREWKSTKGKMGQLKLERYFAEQTIMTAGAQVLDAKTNAERKKNIEDIEKCNKFLRRTKKQFEEYERTIKTQETKLKELKDKIKASKSKKKSEKAEKKDKADSGDKGKEQAKKDDGAFRDAANRAKDAYSTKKGRSAKTYINPGTYFPQLGDGTSTVNPAPEIQSDTHGQQTDGSTCSGD
jgi:hypothetical protein